MDAIQLGDLHYCEKYLKEVHRCAVFSLGACPKVVDFIFLPGDLFDRSCNIHDKSVMSLMVFLRELAELATVIILQGTFSHDVPGSLEPLTTISDNIKLLDTIGQTMFTNNITDESVLVSHLPPINKGQIAAKSGVKEAGLAASGYVHDLMIGWSEKNIEARENGIPTVLISHGTVAMSITETGCPMAGSDHEFTPESLFAAQADAVMLNHIHQHQFWESKEDAGEPTRKIAYAGSIGRLHFGEEKPKGFLVWDIKPGQSEFEFIETPAKKLIHIDFGAGEPDMIRLAEESKEAKDAHVRIRYTVREDRRDTIDTARIKRLFEKAEELKIEPSTTLITRTRATGITKTDDVYDKIRHWGETVNIDAQPSVDRAELLKTYSVDEIVNNIISTL